MVQLNWIVSTNRLYQIDASANLVSWTPVSAWLQASNSPTMSYSVTNRGAFYFYRLQVQP